MKYVAFIEDNHYCGFTSKKNWDEQPALWQEDISLVVEFDGPDFSTESGYTDETFEELKTLAKEAATKAGYAVDY
jgi:hypothetical protein